MTNQPKTVILECGCACLTLNGRITSTEIYCSLTHMMAAPDSYEVEINKEENK